MTPKEKAQDLVDKYWITDFDIYLEESKQCALIAVDEIIDLLPNINLIAPIHRKSDEFYFQYWHSVKQEIEKL